MRQSKKSTESQTETYLNRSWEKAINQCKDLLRERVFINAHAFSLKTELTVDVQGLYALTMQHSKDKPLRHDIHLQITWPCIRITWFLLLPHTWLLNCPFQTTFLMTNGFFPPFHPISQDFISWLKNYHNNKLCKWAINLPTFNSQK